MDAALVKKKQKDECEIRYDLRPWADLQQELLDIISSNLNIPDFLRFGRVCRNWRLFYSEAKRRFMASQSPLAISISIEPERSCNFYDITNQIRYTTKLPNHGLRYVHISNGYLIFRDISTKGFLLINPITGHQLQFSPMPNPDDTVSRAIFASVGSRPELDPFFVILSKMYLRLSVFKDNKWKSYPLSHKQWSIEDITVFRGRIFFLTSLSEIGVVNLKSSDFMLLKLKGAPTLSLSARFVSSYQQLLIVNIFWTIHKIYRIRFSRSEWVEILNLNDNALFFDDNTCYYRSSNTTQWGGRRNCLYYLPLESNTYSLYSLNGDLLETIPIVNADFHPKTLKAYHLWYLPSQIYNIDTVKDD